MSTRTVWRSPRRVDGPNHGPHQRASARLLPILAVALAVISGLAVLAGCGSSRPRTGPEAAEAATSSLTNSAEKSFCCGTGSKTGYVDAIVYNKIPATTLTLLNKEGSSEKTDPGKVKVCEDKASYTPPQSLGPASSAGYCVRRTEATGKNTYSQFQYRIGDGPFVLSVYFKAAWTGSHSAKCNISKGGGYSEQGSLPATYNISPYGCGVWFRGPTGYNSGHRVEVGLKPTTVIQPPYVENGKNTSAYYDALDVLNRNCVEPQGSCTYTDRVPAEAFNPERVNWPVLGGTTLNNTGSNLEHLAKETWTASTTTEWGGEVNLGVAKVVQAGVKASYKTSTATKYEVSVDRRMNIFDGREGGFFVEPGYLRIRADWLVGEDAKVYSIKDFTFDLPLSGTINGTPPSRAWAMVWCIKPSASGKETPLWDGSGETGPDGLACDRNLKSGQKGKVGRAPADSNAVNPDTGKAPGEPIPGRVPPGS